MSRSPKPHDAIYVIARLDGEAARLGDLVALPKAFRSESAAKAEAERLNHENSTKGARYRIIHSRLMHPPNETGSTTRRGFINPNGQVVLRPTGLPGTDHLQKVYVLLCTQPGCGHEYGANGSDIHARLCPVCQGGAEGLPF